MNKTKLIALTMALLMLLAVFASCSGKPANEATDDDKATITNNDEATDDTAGDTENVSDGVSTDADGYITSVDMLEEKIGAHIDMSMYTTGNVIEEEKYTIYSYDLKYEHEKDYDLDYKVKLSDGTEFTMPVSLSSLTNANWTLVGSAGDNTLLSGYAGNSKIENGDGLYTTVLVYNDTDMDITFKEGKICGIILKQYNDVTLIKEENAAGFTVCDSLTRDSSIEDVLKRLGVPSSISYQIDHTSEGEYENSKITLNYAQKTEIGARINFTFSGDDNCIYNVEYEIA